MNNIVQFWQLNRGVSENLLRMLRYEKTSNAFRTLEKKFCIACSARSGSSYLTVALERYSLNVQEYFNTHGFVKQLHENHGVNTTNQFASYLVTHHSPNQVFGVKAPYEAVAVYAFLGELSTFSKEWKVVFLTRNNILRQAISALIASLTNQWTHVMPSRYEVTEKDYDFKKILELIDSFTLQNKKWERFFSLLKVTPYRISYERLTEQPAHELENIAKFVGVDTEKFPESHIHKPWIQSQSTAINSLWEERFLEDCRIKLNDDYDLPWDFQTKRN